MSIISYFANLFKKKKVDSQFQITLRQSSLYVMLSPFVVFEKQEKVIQTQATEFMKKQFISVILLDHQAYWIMNNTLYVADEINGSIDKESTRPVDTMTMDKVQLDKTIFIVNALTEGAENDNRNSGN